MEAHHNEEGPKTEDPKGNQHTKKKKKKNANRTQHDAQRASEWRAEKAARPQNEEPRAGPSTSYETTDRKETTETTTTWTRKLWIRGSTLFKKKKTRQEELPRQTAEEASAPSADPTETYKALEETYKLSRIEEVGNLTTALRHLTRHQHPKGNKICFPVPEAVDILQLHCANLPSNPEELGRLVTKVYERRGAHLDRESLYRDYVMAHGRLAMNTTKQFPNCYYQTRQP
jgi:hypothetical protein